MSVYYDILHAIKDHIIEQELLPVVDDLKRVPEDHIQIWLPQILNAGKENYKSTPSPGLIISPSRTVRVPPSAGTNSHDDVHYPVLLQIITSDTSRASDERIKQILQWSENLRKFFNQQNLRLEVYSSDGFVDLAIATSQDMLVEQLFGIHHLCVSYIPITVISREPRNSAGSL